MRSRCAVETFSCPRESLSRAAALGIDVQRAFQIAETFFGGRNCREDEPRVLQRRVEPRRAFCPCSGECVVFSTYRFPRFLDGLRGFEARRIHGLAEGKTVGSMLSLCTKHKIP
jgi:hypothetical protein